MIPDYLPLFDEEDVKKKTQKMNEIHSGTYQTTNTDVLMREGSFLSYNALEIIPKGTKLFIDNVSYDLIDYEIWCQVTYNSKEDWIPYRAIDLDYFP